MKVVIDTNVFVSALSSKSKYHWLVVLLLDEKLSLCVTDDIVLEYEEILTLKYAPTVANNFITALRELPNVIFTPVYFKWNLLTDHDDNKFVDCAIAANADYLITHDNDFNILKNITFPKVDIITIHAFENLINKSG